MPKLNLTKTAVASLPLADGRPIDYFDTKLTGFHVRVGARRKTYYLLHWNARANRRVRTKIGVDGVMTTARARELASDEANLFAARRLDAPVERDTVEMTLRQAAEQFFDNRQAQLRPATIRGYKTSLYTHLNDWLDMPVTEITPNMVLDRHAELTRNSGKAAANVAFRYLSPIINYFSNRYRDKGGMPAVPYNPVLVLRDTKSWNPSKRRQTIVKNEDQGRLFKGIINMPSETYRDYLLLLWQTGSRRTEVAALPWANVDLERRTYWHEETKNGDPLWLPMPDFIYELFLFRREHYPGGWVFPSETSASGHLSEPSHVLKLARKASGLHFTLHDLRRGFITAAATAGIGPYVIKRLVNHRLSYDVTEGYFIPQIEALREPAQQISDYLLAQANVNFIPYYGAAA